MSDEEEKVRKAKKKKKRSDGEEKDEEEDELDKRLERDEVGEILADLGVGQSEDDVVREHRQKPGQ